MHCFCTHRGAVQSNRLIQPGTCINNCLPLPNLEKHIPILLRLSILENRLSISECMHFFTAYKMRFTNIIHGLMRPRTYWWISVPSELRAPEEFLKWRYNLLDTSATRVIHYIGWKARNPAHSRQHAWHSCRAGCIVISENPQGLATHRTIHFSSWLLTSPCKDRETWTHVKWVMTWTNGTQPNTFHMGQACK